MGIDFDRNSNSGVRTSGAIPIGTPVFEYNGSSSFFFYFIGFPLAGPFAFDYLTVIDIAALIPNIITMFIMTLFGALIGAWISIRRLKTKNVANK